MTAFPVSTIKDQPLGPPITPNYTERMEPTVDGDWQYEGSNPGFWTTTWRSQVSSNIDNGLFGDIVAAITSPAQFSEANSAPSRIYSGLMKDYPKELEALNVIEQDNTKTGKDWYDGLPKEIKDQMESLGLSPTKYDTSAYEFANDYRQTAAYVIYNRDVSRGYEQYNDFALLGANIGVSVGTDPTTIVSLGAGNAAKGTSVLSKFGFKSTLAMNAGLATAQNVDSLIHRDYMSERLGIIPGDVTGGDVATEALKTAALATATGGTLYAAGYYAGMGLSKFSRKTSAKAEELAHGLTNNPNILSNQQAEQILNKINDGVGLEPNEQAAILAETLNIAYGTHFDTSVWDWGAMDAVGVRPIDLARSVAEDGYSGKQIQDILNYAYKVLDDAKEVHVAPVGPQVPTIAEKPPVFTITGPLLPIRQLPDYMVQAGYTWDPIGRLVKDPNKAVTTASAVTETPVKTTTQSFQEMLKLADQVSEKADKRSNDLSFEQTKTDLELSKLNDEYERLTGLAGKSLQQHASAELSTKLGVDSTVLKDVLKKNYGVGENQFTYFAQKAMSAAFGGGKEEQEVLARVAADLIRWDLDKKGLDAEGVLNSSISGLTPEGIKDLKNTYASHAKAVHEYMREVASGTIDFPIEIPVSSQAAVKQSPPVKQPLLPEVVDTIKSVSKLSDNPVESALLESTDYTDFVNRLTKLVKTTKLSKEQIELVTKLGNDEVRYSQNKDLLYRNTPDTDAKLSPDTLIQEVRKLTGRQDTLVTRDPKENVKSSPLLEIPNTVDRLVWMTGRSWGQTVKDASGDVNLEKSLTYKGTAEKILGDYFGMGVRDIMVHRAKMEQALKGLKLGRAPIDRIQVVRNSDGSYSATILRIAQDPQAGPSTQRLNAKPKKDPTSRADKEANRRNAAIDKKLKEKQDAFNAKLNKTLNSPKEPEVTLEVPGLSREKTLAYNEFVRKGQLADAYALLRDELVGPGNFPEIIKLSLATKAANEELDTALRTGVEKDINEAKAKFNKINDQLAKQKQRLFAVADTKNFGKLKLLKPLDATKGPLSARAIGTPFNPAKQLHVEPIGIDNEPASHQATLLLNRAFMNADAGLVASRIDVDVPKGWFASIADTLTGLNSALFFQSESGRLLLNKQPILGHLVNAVAPSRLMNASELGTTKITPSNETMHARNQAEGFAVVKKTVDKLRDLKIYVGSDEMHRAVTDAMIERHFGTTNATTKYRAATDILKSEFFPYFDKVNAEGVAVGKIKQVDSTYIRSLLNQEAHHDIDGVNQAFFKSFIEWLMKDDSPVHKETLETLTSVSISDKPINTLADLKAANEILANQYIEALQKAGKGSRAYQQITKMVRVKMGLDVTDDISIIRESDHYMNSGFGQTIDTEIMLSPRMQKYLVTDLSQIIDEYNRNVRYYISRQEVTDRLIANLTGENIKGITWNDLIKYTRSKYYEHFPDQQKEIDLFFNALVSKEGQITGRSRAFHDYEQLADGIMALAAAPIQTGVVAGVSTTSTLAETAKMLASTITTSLHGTGGNRTFLSNLGNIIRSMGKPDIMAGMSAMMQAQTHGMLREIDRPITNYSGGYYLPTKIANIKRAYKNVYDAARNNTHTKATKVSNVMRAIAGAMVEPVKQITHIDNLTAINYRGYHSQGLYKMAGVLEQFMNDPKFFDKVKRNEIVNRLEEAGLFSKEAKLGLSTFLKKNPKLIYGQFEMNDLANILVDIRSDPNVSNEAASAAQMFFTGFWGAAERFADSRIMTTARLWDQGDPNVSPALNRLFNTFSGYSRWFFSRQMLQNFPNSKMHKVAALLGWYVTAEAIAMLLRDAMLDFNKFEQMIDSEDDELFDTYMTKAMLRVPLFGQLTNGTFSALVEAHDLFVSPENKFNTSDYRSPGMFSGARYYYAMQEMAKAAKGEDYDPEKIRKATPYFSAPIFGGWLKAAQQE